VVVQESARKEEEEVEKELVSEQRAGRGRVPKEGKLVVDAKKPVRKNAESTSLVQNVAKLDEENAKWAKRKGRVSKGKVDTKKGHKSVDDAEENQTTPFSSRNLQQQQQQQQQ
jgi:hypothetical protein